VNDGLLETGNQREGWRTAQKQQIGGFPAAFLERGAADIDFRIELRVSAQIIQDGCLDSAEAEIVGVSFDLYRSKMQSVVCILD
jgi:hypothetical protein